MKRKNRTMVRGVAGRVKAFLPFYLFTLLPLNIHGQQISAKNEVIDCGSVVYEQPVTAKFELQNMSSNPLVIKNVRTSCGCTTVEYPKGQIAPGESFVVNATYDSRQMGHFFKDIFRVSENCRFNNCTHTHEPGCAVIEAVERHDISQSRYNSYLSMLEDHDADRYRKSQ